MKQSKTVETGQPKYRHEYKYLSTGTQHAVLKLRAEGILKKDPHAGVDGCYRIRSLYFDSRSDSCYYENQAGADLRDKYRIRFYNKDRTYITLEKKSKTHQMTSKISSEISETLCRQLMERVPITITEDMPATLRQLLLELQERCMRPAVIVEYIRYPYIERNGNVRVTFDEHICSSNDITHFLEDNLVLRPILEPGRSILEVKWDAFLPDYIKTHLELASLQWSSFSKYYLCRKYNTYGGIRI